MRKIFMLVASCLLVTIACSENNATPDNNNNNNGGKTPDVVEAGDLAEQNILRAMQITDSAVVAHFTGSGMAMAQYYNPYTKVRSSQIGSVWKYTAVIETVNAILHTLTVFKEHGRPELYDTHFSRYVALLDKLYDNIDYYLGTFWLVSYTQTKQWSVYAVNRSSGKGGANVEGKSNVYDDQEWLIRELLESYKVTGNNAYLEKAEYLTEYVLDGWDCTRDANGNERGGIPWGPGYVSKHSCSNGPMVSPLVWLHELYKDKNDEIEYRYIDASDKKTRRTQMVKKRDHYLDFAKKIYAWQKGKLLNSSGVYEDNYHSCTPNVPSTEVINGVTYRQGISCSTVNGPPITYNSGSMLSGAADLYRVTGTAEYLTDAKKLSDATFAYFPKIDVDVPGYYTYDISGHRNWFNGVLMRGYVDIYPRYNNVAVPINTFQLNLDYAYENFFYKGFLPMNLLLGWSRTGNENNQTEGMFTFAFAAEYAVLARYEIEK